MDHSSELTAADGTQIWYGTSGSGPAVVLCDGLACDGFIWPYVIDRLVDHYTIVRWHYRGHGCSEDPSDLTTMTIEQIADDLGLVLDALDVDSAVLAGHSMGVQIILEFYARQSERVDGLIPICGSYKRPLDTLYNTDLLAKYLPHLETLVEAAPEAVQSFWETFIPSKVSYLIATTAAVNTRLARGSDFVPYLEHVAQMDLRVFLHLLKSAAEHSAQDVLPRVEAPTLIIAGEQDELTPLHRSEEMDERLPDSELIVLPGGTHVGPIELPDLVGEAIESFLERIELR